MVHVIQTAGALLLLVAPGYWLVIRGPLSGYPRLARGALAIVLAPVVVAAQFYVLRGAGVSFDVTARLLPPVNLPVLWWMVRDVRSAPALSLSSVAWAAVAVSAPTAYLWYWMHDPLVRANWGHAWTHTDIAYILANGALRPEEPYLAAVRMSYPWAGHVIHAVVAALLDRPPNVTYLLPNLALLAGSAGLAVSLTAELGGERRARSWVPIWMCFGVNVAGIAWWILPQDVIARWPRVWGDGRFTPWLRKFGIFEPTVLGIALVMALIYVVARPSAGRTSWPTAVTAAALVFLLSVFYPVLLPAGVAIVGARVVASVVAPWLASRLRGSAPLDGGANRREVVRFVVTGLVAVALAIPVLRAVTVDRGPDAAVGLATPYDLKIKLASAVLILAPLAIGAALAWERARDVPVEVLTLVGAAVTGAFLYSVFHVYWDHNEYKYIYPAAAALAPLAAIGYADLPRRYGRAGWLALALAGLVVILPGFYRQFVEAREVTPPPVHLATGHFELSLDGRETDAPVVGAIRTGTPEEAVLLAARRNIDLIAVTGRAMYVPAETGFVHGVGIGADHLLKRARGYPAALVDRRRARLRTVLDSAGTVASATLDSILRELGRPVIVVTDPQDSTVRRWLPARTDARPLGTGDQPRAWLVGVVPSR